MIVCVESPGFTVPGHVPPSPTPPELPAPELLTPELPAPELPAPELATPELPTPELPVPELPASELTPPELPAPELPELEWLPELDPEPLRESAPPESLPGPPELLPAVSSLDDVPHAKSHSGKTPRTVHVNRIVRGLFALMFVSRTRGREILPNGRGACLSISAIGKHYSSCCCGAFVV
jgi:hypothetical protein